MTVPVSQEGNYPLASGSLIDKVSFSVPNTAEVFVFVCKLATYWRGDPRKHWLRSEVLNKEGKAASKSGSTN